MGGDVNIIHPGVYGVKLSPATDVAPTQRYRTAIRMLYLRVPVVMVHAVG